MTCLLFFFSSRRRHTRSLCDWSSDVCSSDLGGNQNIGGVRAVACGPGATRAVDCGGERAGPFLWEILQEGKDYYVDGSGAWFALASRLDQTDYLAVSYVPVAAIACGPGQALVGTFPVGARQ